MIFQVCENDRIRGIINLLEEHFESVEIIYLGIVFVNLIKIMGWKKVRYILYVILFILTNVLKEIALKLLQKHFKFSYSPNY